VQPSSENKERDFMEDRKCLVIGAAGGSVEDLLNCSIVTASPWCSRAGHWIRSTKLLGHARARPPSWAMHPLGRIGQPDEIAQAIEFLLGIESAWRTGQVLGVDGPTLPRKYQSPAKERVVLRSVSAE